MVLRRRARSGRGRQRRLARVIAGETPGAAAETDHRTWYRELFAPSVAAGLAQPADLAGYRDVPVYVGGSRHAPPSPDGVREAMPAFFELLREEPEPAVRAVLGHFAFVYTPTWTATAASAGC